MSEQYYRRSQIIEIFQFDERFLEELEAEDLISSVPSETSREPVFSPDQVDRLRVIATLVQELEVNLAGVEVILEMRANMIRMQHQFDEILDSLVRELKCRLP
jgi:MerR family transcriptional regulator, heat shock protein HspR